MKIQIAKVGEETIGGYNHIVCSDNYINFMEVSDNECTEIVASEVLDLFDIDKVKDCLVAMVGKLRLGGTLAVGGTDIRLFSRLVMNNMISEEEASQIIKKSNSMPQSSLVTEILASLGLNIVTVNLSGIHFEVVAKRG